MRQSISRRMSGWPSMPSRSLMTVIRPSPTVARARDDCASADPASLPSRYRHPGRAVPWRGERSRLRLWLCACVPVVRVRVASDTFDATCNRCGSAFTRATAQ